MIDVNSKRCYGCSACFAVCPRNCIKMHLNVEGFLYPEIDVNQCVSCGKCESVCPIDINQATTKEPTFYSAININEEERNMSSSGGVFLPLARLVIDAGGVVFGAAFDSDFLVKHFYAETIEDVKKFCGSKYLQSDINESFFKVRQFLDSGRTVLFTGSPCQVGGLKYFLGRDYENLFTVDFICHGVPSPTLWQKYISSFRKGNPKSVSFRNKELGWSRYSVRIEFDDYTYSCKYSDDRFMEMFLSDFSLRESCFNCDFKNRGNAMSDVTIADFWGVDKFVPKINDNKGVSLVIVNTEKGEDKLEKIKQSFELVKVTDKDVLSSNSAANNCANRSSRREMYLKALKNKDFNFIYNYRYQPTKLERIKTKIAQILTH